MKNPLIAGAIAGVFAGIVHTISAYTFYLLFGIIEPVVRRELWDISLIRLFILAALSLGVIWGAIFGAIYSRFYDRIPGKGMLKGLSYGLLIWLIKDIAAGSYTALIGTGVTWGIGLILVGFFVWIAYGPVLAILYKK